MGNLTFGQEQGFEPLPAQARLGSISQETLAKIWHVVHAWLHLDADYEPADDRMAVLKRWWVNAKHRMVDEIPEYTSGWEKALKAELQRGFPAPYNLLQFLLSEKDFAHLAQPIAVMALEDTRAAYRIVEGKIVPFTSDAEHQALTNAVNAATASGAEGVKTHLMNAASELTAGNWASSVHESISAVEGAAKFVSGEHGKDLNKALDKLKADGQITHPALVGALKQLYGYTSDAKGVRHALVLEGTATVTEREAFLMYGICASMVGYLLGL